MSHVTKARPSHTNQPARCLASDATRRACLSRCVWFLLLLVAVSLAGCVSVTTPSGLSYTRLGKSSVAGAKVLTPDGYVIELEDYASEGEGLIEAAARGAVQGANP